MFPSADDYKQRVLLYHINRYYKKMGYPLIDIEGYCHGLTLLWLTKMDEGKEDDFYTTKENIIKWSLNNEFEKFEDIDVQKFLVKIEYGQNSVKYTYDLDDWGASAIKQEDIHKILETDKPVSKSGIYNSDKVNDFFISANQFGNAIVFRSRTNKKHTVGMYIRNNKYFFFDPNFKSGKAKEFFSQDELFKELRTAFYTNFGLNEPKKMNIEIKIVNMNSHKDEKPTSQGLFGKQKNTQLEEQCESRKKRRVV